MRKALPVKILGTGSYAPPKTITNDDLSKRVDTNDEWIMARTGIKQRHVAEKDLAASDMAVHAARAALEAAEVKPEEIDMIVFATSSPDRVVPASAVYLQEKLGCVNAGAVDNLAACAGFVYALSNGWALVANGQSKRCLVLGAEVLSKITNYDDRATCILFGDASGAMVLAPSDDESDILYAKMGADGRLADLIIAPAGGTAMMPTPERWESGEIYIQMKGREVYKFAVPKFVEIIREALAACDLSLEDLKLVIPHQMNARMIEAVRERLGLPEEKVFLNIQNYGNTSSASIPVAFDEAVREGRLERGDLVLLTAMGAGLAWGTIILRW
jgi:3-oxoacyl-[acyl-carrier-protein] synthase-3